MISESRDDFTQWIIDSYNSLHDTLFDGGKFKINYVLSGEMLCYLLVKPWKKRVDSDEYFKEDADIRQEVDEQQVADVRDYLDNPTMDVQAAMVRYFLPTEGDYPAYLDSEIGKSLFQLVLNYGLPERLRFVKEKKPEKVEGDALQETIERELEYLTTSEGFENLYFHLMDYVDRLNECGEDIPEDFRKFIRLLESKEDYLTY